MRHSLASSARALLDVPSPSGAPLPTPESAGRKALLHTVAITTLLVLSVYLTWRATATIDWSGWWIAVPLLMLEIRAAVGLGLFTVALWDLDVRPPWRPVTETDLRVAVVIPTYDEPIEILLPTVAAAARLSPAHETWILDDGDRAEIKSLADRLGVRYLARPTHEHAKAGNLNHALTRIEADVIAVFDADHVADAKFLRNTLGYFDDPKIALVQTPQEFYNTDSFEHDRGGFQNERIFYRAIAAGKNRWQAAFWAGTCAVVRTSALMEVGGVATNTVTEDILTTMRMHRRGWKTVYHNEVLALGLAASDASRHLLQRNRWALGAMQVIRAEGPLRGPGLTFAQRIAYATTLLGWFDSWRLFNFLCLPLLVLATGVAPMAVSPDAYIPAFLITTSLSYVSMALLSRGHYRPVLSLTFAIAELPAILPATRSLFLPGTHRFRVTPKGAAERSAPNAPRLLWSLLVATVLGTGWGAASLAGLTPTTFREPWVGYGALVFNVINMALIWSAITRIRSPRFWGDQRGAFRFDRVLTATLDGQPCQVQDISVTGARVVIPPLSPSVEVHGPGRLATLLVALPDGVTLSLRCATVGNQRAGESSVGLRFEPGQERQLAMLVPVLFDVDHIVRLGEEHDGGSGPGQHPGTIVSLTRDAAAAA